MTATHAARRESAFTRLARRLRPATLPPLPEGFPDPRPGHAWAPPAEVDRREAADTRRDLEAMFSAPAPHAEVPDGPVHMVADGYGMMPCCGQHETAVPVTDYVTGNPRLVTCRPALDRRQDQRYVETAIMPVIPAEVPAECSPPCPLDAKPPDADLLRRILDGLRALDVSEPPAADLCADLAGLAIFREALSQRTRDHAGECLCGHPVSGGTWGERMVRVGIHLLAGAA